MTITVAGTTVLVVWLIILTIIAIVGVKRIMDIVEEISIICHVLRKNGLVKKQDNSDDDKWAIAEH